MKVFPFVLSVLACAATFASTTISANAQGPWEISYITFDSSESYINPLTSGSGTTSYTFGSGQSLSVTASGSGLSYVARILGAEYYTINFAWSGGGSPDANFEFAIGGECQGYTTCSSANGTSGCYIANQNSDQLLAGSTNPPPSQSSSYDNKSTSGVNIEVSLSSPVPSSTTYSFELFANAFASGGNGGSGSSTGFAQVDSFVTNPTDL